MNQQSRLFRGPNFSGRSDAIGALVARARGFLIRPDLLSAFSGVSETLEREIRYFAAGIPARAQALAFLETLGVSRLLSRNPVTLSGGEQSIAALAAAIASGAQLIGADCCFEQLDACLRERIYDVLRESCESCIAAADNRAEEHVLPPFVTSTNLPSTEATSRAALNVNLFPERSTLGGPLHLKDIMVRYRGGDGFLLNVPDLHLAPGRVYRLRGPNGSGKSTLCRVLVGLLRPQSGSIFADGKRADIWRHPGRFAVLSFQNPDDQLFASDIRSELMDRGCPENLVIPALRGLGIPDSVETHPGSLPFVLRKRLSLAATLSAAKGWYILDEPTIGQDERSTQELARLVAQLAERGSGVIIITHSETFATLLGAEELTLSDGVCVQT